MDALIVDPNVEELDISTIRDFYDSMRGVLLSLEMLYPQIIFHCIDDDMMDFGSETMLWCSVGCLML